MEPSQVWQYIPARLRDFWGMYTEPPALPAELEYLWRWFLQLHQSRGNNGMGHSPITYQDMHAWSHITGNRLQAFEVDAIRRLDHVYFESLEKAGDSEG